MALRKEARPPARNDFSGGLSPRRRKGSATTRKPPNRPRLANWARELANLLIPLTCPICERWIDRTPCSECLAAWLSPVPDPHLSRWQQALGHSIWAAGLYEGRLRESVLFTKWVHPALGQRLFFGSFCERARGPIEDFGADAIVAIPRTRWRRLTRGRPLAEDLASQLARKLNLVELPSTRRRSRAPQTQVRGKARLTNLRGSFYLRKRDLAQYRGKRIALVDDVLTTGSTLLEASRAIAPSSSAILWIVIALSPDAPPVR